MGGGCTRPWGPAGALGAGHYLVLSKGLWARVEARDTHRAGDRSQPK